MVKPKPKPKRKSWTASTQNEIAEFFGVSLNTAQNWTQAGCPGQPGKYQLNKIAQWLRKSGPWRQHAKPDTTDPLLAADVDSPGLERYRLAKAALAELELEERRGSLIPLEKVREALGHWAMLIRRMGESLGKRFGNEAAELLNETLAECRRIVPKAEDSANDSGTSREANNADS